MQENLIEIFSSIQGEGKYVGCRQIFVRFEGCNLACRYCDTENVPGRHPFCRVETAAGSRSFREVPNPLRPEDVHPLLGAMLAATPHQAVSFTGGEPLLHTGFIQALAAGLGAKVFLETNGTLHEELASVLDCVDIISMDVKLPSVVGRELWAEHRRFLALAREKDLYVKMVISAETEEAEFRAAVRLLKETAPKALLVLQPVTPYGGCAAAAPEKMLAYQARALEQLADVRVIPQTHRMMGQF